jgi:hypothetical protein
LIKDYSPKCGNEFSPEAVRIAASTSKTTTSKRGVTYFVDIIINYIKIYAAVKDYHLLPLSYLENVNCEEKFNTKKWTELKNVRTYYEFFKDNKDEFEKELD